MKKKILSLAITMVFLLNVAAPAFADSTPVSTTSTATTEQTVSVTGSEATTTVDAGTLPDSPVYVVDTLIEKIILIFTFSPEKKAKKLLANANERLEEAKVMTDEGKQELATETAEVYVATVEKAQVQITIAINEGTLSDTVDSTVYGTVYNKKGSSVVAIVYGLDLSQKHAAEVLVRVLAKSPEAARKGLINALQNVLKHQVDLQIEPKAKKTKDKAKSSEEEINAQLPVNTDTDKQEDTDKHKDTDKHPEKDKTKDKQKKNEGKENNGKHDSDNKKSEHADQKDDQ
jgi:Domain of unknown function (DUF5667)